MKKHMESQLEHLKKVLTWREEECEDSRQAFVTKAAKYTAEELVQGRLDGYFNTLVRDVEGIKSIKAQINLLENMLQSEE
ncbi:hypothetical protein AALA61_11695 [Oscillospiraceae bacterium 42-9]